MAHTVPAAKARIITALQQSNDLSGVTVTWGGPTAEKDHAADHVWLGKTRLRDEWGEIGAYSKHEEYSLELRVQVHRRGANEEQTVEERCWAIVSWIDSVLRDDVTLDSILNRVPACMTDVEQENLPLTDGWLAKATCTVECGSKH